MLRRRVVAFAVAFGIGGYVTVSVPNPVWASDTFPLGGAVVCPPTGGDCIVTAQSFGHGINSPVPLHRPRPGGCRYAGRDWACYDPLLGWFDGAGCYWAKAEPQPARTDPIWDGHYPHGAIYQVACLGPDGTAVPGTGGGWRWRPSPPPEAGRAMQAADLAAEAVGRLHLRGPAIQTSLRPGATGLVGLPVWLWTAVTPQTWGPASATATVPGLTVRVAARADHITYDMGDGAQVTCRSPGTPYVPSDGGAASPTCAHTYATSSAGQPGERYAITGTTTWNVHWTGDGLSGDVTVTRRSSTTIRIGEMQVIVH